MLELKPIFNSLLRSKAGAVMLLVQIAITTAIVSNAAFIINDRIDYLSQDTGYPEDELFSVNVMSFDDDLDLSQKFEETETLIRNIPGVINASIFNAVPLSGSGSSSSVGLGPDDEISKSLRSAYITADENALDTLGVKLLQGRNFRSNEVVVTQSREATVPVAIISVGLANGLFENGEALGESIYFGQKGFEVVGITEPIKGPWLKSNAADNVIFFPLVRASGYQKIIIRTDASQRASIMLQIEEILLNDHDKRVIEGIRGLDKQKERYNAADMLMLRMLVVLITILLLVTALGIFGLTVFNINKRTKQIGTRRALGARKSAIIRYFLVENAIICILGVLVGASTAIYLGNVLLDTYALPALDITYVMFTAICVIIISLASVIMPASKAANISPSIATRSI